MDGTLNDKTGKPVERDYFMIIEGKRKMSQNRSQADREGVAILVKATTTVVVSGGGISRDGGRPDRAGRVRRSTSPTATARARPAVRRNG